MRPPSSERRPWVTGRAASVLWATACLALLSSSAGAEPEVRSSGAAASLPAAVTLERVAGGELLRSTETGLVPLPLGDSTVRLSVHGFLLHGELTQKFHNPYAETIDVLYAFPLPDRAAVHSMELRIGERRIRSVVREREAAKATYVQAKQSGRKAALVDQHRPNLFLTSAANIDPGEEIEVTLEYFEELAFEDGNFSLRFPLTFIPRFTPGSTAGERTDGEARDASFTSPGAARAPSVRIEVDLDPGVSLEAVDSSSHVLFVAEQGGRYAVRTRPDRVAADRDFVLSWRPKLQERPQAAVFLEDHAAGRFALALILPPIPESEAGLGLPTETLFVVDVSGSMQGPSIEQAREALLAALDRLRPEDRFNILKFNDENEPFRAEFQQAEATELEAARAWVRELRADGGTMILPALARGLGLMGQSRSTRAQRIVFLTDGAVGNEEELFRAVTERLGQVRLHAIGIGNAPNAHLMRKLARFGRGMCEFVDSTDRAANAIGAFFERLDRPVMTDLELEWGGIAVEEQYPDRLPDLHAGQPLLLYARVLDGANGGSVTLGGHTRSGWVHTSLAIPNRTVTGQGIATRWARARIDGLLDSLAEGADARDVRDEVVGLGLEFGLVTPYTSLIAVDETATTLGPAGRSVHLSGALPMGGSDKPLRLLVGLVLAGLGLACACGAVWRS